MLSKLVFALSNIIKNDVKYRNKKNDEKNKKEYNEKTFTFLCG